MPFRYSQDLREKCLAAYGKLRSFRKVADVVDVSKSSIQRWMHRVTPIRRAFDARKASARVKSLIHEVLGQEGAALRRSDIAATIKQRLGVEMSSSSVGVLLRRQGYTRKRCSKFVDRPDLPLLRRSFAHRMASMRPEDVVSIDEAGVYIDMKPSYGFSLRGSRCRVPTSAGWRKRFTLLLAVSDDRVIGSRLLDGACNRTTFCDFVRSLDMCGRSCLLMDNASIHKGSPVVEAARAVGADVWYLPPYSPQFQPVEIVFSVVKGAYRRSDATRPVAVRVDECVARVVRDGLRRTFASCWSIASGHKERFLLPSASVEM